jgi:2'-5' RNA ligase
MRLFVSVPLHGLAAEVAAAQDPLDLPGLTLTDPTQAHVTLKFLGEVDESRVDDLTDAVERAVEAADVAPFDAEVGGYGVFPSLGYIRVVWLGFRSETEPSTRLHEAIERETVALGFDPEDHSFTPHATLARMGDARSKDEVREVVESDGPDVGTLRVDGVELTESTLTDDGPRYSTVERFGLPTGV